MSSGGQAQINWFTWSKLTSRGPIKPIKPIKPINLGLIGSWEPNLKQLDQLNQLNQLIWAQMVPGALEGPKTIGLIGLIGLIDLIGLVGPDWAPRDQLGPD